MLGIVHVDHLGAEVGEQGAGERAGDDVGELDDPETFERSATEGGSVDGVRSVG